MASGGLFSFNPSRGETPETLKRRREVAEAMLGGGGAAPNTIGAGLMALGEGLAGGLMLRNANRGIAAGQAGAAEFRIGRADGVVTAAAFDPGDGAPVIRFHPGRS